MIRKCENCAYYREEWDGDYSSIFCGCYCALFESFPEDRFKGLCFPYPYAPGCFCPDFWKTPYADFVDHFTSDISYDKAFEKAYSTFIKWLTEDGDLIRLITSKQPETEGVVE